MSSGQSTGNPGGPPGNPRSFANARPNRRPKLETEARLLGQVALNVNNSNVNYNQNNSNSNQNNSNFSRFQDYQSLAKSSTLNASAKEFVPRNVYAAPPPPPPQSFSYDERTDSMFNLSVSAPAFVPREVPVYAMPQPLPMVDQFAGMSLVEPGENPAIAEFRQVLEELLSSPSGEIEDYMKHIFSNIERSVSDTDTFCHIIDILYSQCVYCPSFQYVGVKVLQCFSGPHVSNALFMSFLETFLGRCDFDFKRREELAVDSNNTGLLCGLAVFLGELFLSLVGDVVIGPRVVQTFPSKLIQMMYTLLNHPSDYSVKTAAQLCKLVGGPLQDTVENDPSLQRQFEDLFNLFRSLLESSRLNEICTVLIRSLFKAKEENWGRNEYYPPSSSAGIPSSFNSVGLPSFSLPCGTLSICFFYVWFADI